jgi:hypothetical protein
VRRKWAALLVLALVPLPAHADPAAESDPVAAALSAAKRAYSLPTHRERCRPKADSDEIVVCADHGEDQRVPPTSETDPNSREAQRALNNGVPRAPDLEKHYPGPSVAGGCLPGSCPKDIYYFDIKALPEAPPGSDAAEP